MSAKRGSQKFQPERGGWEGGKYHVLEISIASGMGVSGRSFWPFILFFLLSVLLHVVSLPFSLF
jgi:hypothetical protein